MINYNKLLPYLAILCLLIFLIGFIGLFFNDNVYSNELQNNKDLMKSWDFTTLFFLFPVITISTIRSLKNSKIGEFSLLGSLLFCIYNFLFYGFGNKFNQLFHLYWIALGLAFYLFIIIMLKHLHTLWSDWFDENLQVNAITRFLVIMGVLFYMLWLSDSIPAAINGVMPTYAKELGYSTSIVHIIDMSFILPLFFIAAYLLKKRHFWGILLGYCSVMFIVFLAVFMLISAIYEVLCGYKIDYESFIIFPLLMAIGWRYIKRILKSIQPKMIQK